MITPEKIEEITGNGLYLPVMEDFYTLQGEGYYQGKAAYFIRLGGCAVGCHWCDVKDSWDFEKWPRINVNDIVTKASTFSGRIAVITGGEPAHYNLTPLTEALHSKGFRTHIETSGILPLSGSWDWVCFSPKKFKDPDFEIFKQANELKVIIFNKTDFSWAESFTSKVNAGCKLYLQPEWSKSQIITPSILDFIMENPKWGLSLQIHKFLNIP